MTTNQLTNKQQIKNHEWKPMTSENTQVRHTQLIVSAFNRLMCFKGKNNTDAFH